MIERAKSLKVQAYDLILDAIIEKTIKKDEVYSEQWFADRFQISRTPVREALLQLRSEGMIETLPNRGIMVKPMSIADMKDVFQMRMAVEGYCAAYLAQCVRDGNPEVQTTLREIETVLYSENSTESRETDLQFHLEMIRFTGNDRFLQSFMQMRSRIDIYWSVALIRQDRSKNAFFEHEQIIKAIRAGDREAAYFLTLEHLQKVSDDVEANFLAQPDRF